MIYKVDTYYINSKSDQRLIRYDVIKLDNDTYQVKVFEDQQRGIAQPSLVAQIDDFQITREDYDKKYPSGLRQPTIMQGMAPGFENTIDSTLQEHRNKLS